MLGCVAIVLSLVVLFTWRQCLVQWHHHMARQRLATRENHQALAPLQAALRLDPEQAETFHLLARAYRRLGHEEKAFTYLNRAKTLGGESTRIDRERWILLAQLGRLREAEPHLAELLMDPRDDGADICEAYVQGYFTNLRVRDAVELLDVWQKEYPEDAKPHFMRGYLLHSLGKLPASASAYRSGLQLNPQETNMRCQLAEVLMEQNEYAEAGRLLELCVNQEPNNPDILIVQAQCLFRQNDAKQAEKNLRQILSTNPGHFMAHRLFGEIELALGHFEQALSHAETAVGLRPFDTTAHNTLGNALRALGRGDEAKPHHDYVAEAETSLGRMERQLREVVDQPENVQLRYEIGVTLLKYGSPADGIKWLRSVLELQPDHQLTRKALAGR
jgi:tetratricopeptide (TPR) repeat protein